MLIPWLNVLVMSRTCGIDMHFHVCIGPQIYGALLMLKVEMLGTSYSLAKCFGISKMNWLPSSISECETI